MFFDSKYCRSFEVIVAKRLKLILRIKMSKNPHLREKTVITGMGILELFIFNPI